jgi:hypothetical protein
VQPVEQRAACSSVSSEEQGEQPSSKEQGSQWTVDKKVEVEVSEPSVGRGAAAHAQRTEHRAQSAEEEARPGTREAGLHAGCRVRHLGLGTKKRKSTQKKRQAKSHRPSRIAPSPNWPHEPEPQEAPRSICTPRGAVIHDGGLDPVRRSSKRNPITCSGAPSARVLLVRAHLLVAYFN